MTSPIRLLSAVLLLAAGLAPLRAQTAEPPEPAHFVFVLHADKQIAEVFDGASLTPLAAPEVGFGAFRAFGLPGSNDTGAGAKFYVLAPRAVRVLDAGFRPTATIALSTPALAGRQGAALSSDGATLMVATSAGLYLIDTATDAVASYLPAGFPVAGVALSTDPGIAYLAASGQAMLRPVDLGSRMLLDELALPALPLESWDRSANGLRAFGLAGDSLYELNEAGTLRYTGAIEPLLRSASQGSRWLAGGSSGAQAKAPLGGGETPKRRIEATNSGWVYMEENGRVLRQSLLGGAAALVSDARTTQAIELDPKGGWDASPSGDAVYVTTAARQLTRFSADDAATVQTAALLEAGGEVEAVAPRVQQSGSLTLTSGSSLVVAGGTRFQIVVKAADAAGAAQSGVPVFVSNRFPTAPETPCFTAITDANGEATIDCRLGTVTSPTAIQITLSDTRGRSAPIVNVQAVIPTDFEGLSLISGGGERIPPDIEYQIVAQASRRRVPLVGETLALTTVPARGALTCPRTAITDATGKATFACRSAIELESTESVEFTIRDSANNSLTGTVIVDPTAIAPTGLTKVQGDGQLVPQGEPIDLVVSSYRDGAPRAKTQLNITVLDPGTPPAMTCPCCTLTDNEGIGRFTCRAGTIFGARRTVEIQVSDFGVTLAEPFKVIVTESSFGLAQTLEFITEEDLKLPVGRPILNAVRVRAVTTDGAPVPNATIYFTQLSPGELTIDPPVAQTNTDGIASATLTVGCNSTAVDVGVGLQPDSSFSDFTVSPEAGNFSQVIIDQGDGQSGAPGQPLNAVALRAITADACGLPITQENVTWRVKPAFAATLRATVNRSDSLGRVSTLITLGQYGGPFEVEVGAGEAVATFNLAVNLAAQELRAVSGNGQMAATGQAAEQPLVVQTLGSNGFGVSEVPVQWAVVEGAATITQSQTTSGAAGIAFARVRVTGAGNPRVRVQATALGQSVSFVLNSTDGPQATAAGFTNGGSFETGWTPGGTGTIFGVNLAEQLISASSAPFPTTLGGVTVKLNGDPVPIIFVSQGQINIQVPFNAAAGPAAVEIDNNGKVLTVSGVQINPVQPGVYEISVDGKTIAAALHQDGTLIRPTSPAIPGEVVQLFFTGAGALNPAVATNQPGPTSPLPLTVEPVAVKLGGVEQEGFGSFYAPGLISANQVNFRVGAGEAAGDRELTLDMNGVVSKTVVLPVGAAQ